MLAGTAAWFDQTVTVAAYSGSSSDGAPTYGTGASRPARVVPRSSHAITEQGRVAQAAATVYVLGPEAVGVKDLLTLPDGEAREILSVTGHRGPDGAVWYYEVTV